METRMTTSRRRITMGFASLFAIALIPRMVAAQNLPARSNIAGGVQVTVTPKTVGTGPTWDFEVSMNTHIKPLDTDLASEAVLIVNGSQRYAPSSWQGDPPGGHHRKGVLRFPAPNDPAELFEVQIQNIGGVKQRVFQWTMK
jgi:hypothetical protein